MFTTRYLQVSIYDKQSNPNRLRSLQPVAADKITFRGSKSISHQKLLGGFFSPQSFCKVLVGTHQGTYLLLTVFVSRIVSRCITSLLIPSCFRRLIAVDRGYIRVVLRSCSLGAGGLRRRGGAKLTRRTNTDGRMHETRAHTSLSQQPPWSHNRRSSRYAASFH